ncbi:putative conserved oligomeric Golgi complex subunit 6-like isoform X1 [Trypanosoma theileri]|uniref:Conserved oligomeric Golgi complex subunit 6 n=1 Tax=Trypanosoma theileri TaxID=67003 RepID=A0A1X0P8L6_9TRYP|nr:putative conserved oligomeric Golgi complex subunit 6-like isoform X1 [Trypanosoma theileri]ORC93262.1 putative conserved oligomeric Golgi complex subunit 6-like isoform X1 [Trypanosoma theileri]
MERTRVRETDYPESHSNGSEVGPTTEGATLTRERRHDSHLPLPSGTVGTHLSATPVKNTGIGGLDDNVFGTASESTSNSTRNFATSRKVQKLLDVTVNDNFRELVLYMNDAVPEFLESFLSPAGGDASTIEKDNASTVHQSPQNTVALSSTANSTFSSSSTALRTALEGRVVDLHRHFLQEWSMLNEVFEEASDLVSKLNQESELLESTLNAHAVQAEEFVARMTTLQAELSLVQQREKEMREFQEKYHFAAEEQAILEESPVDAAYLDVLRRAQVTHRKCRELLLSREHYQSAAAVMDITYTAIMKGTEKVARFLMSASSNAPGATPTNAAAFGGDSPEVTSFYLRCVHFLREENINQWAAVVEEVARLRRAAVLRQYFHLMTTGSVTTSSGTYRAGGKSDESSSQATGGTRPLEAEISNPVFFFSSLFAWLHQVIVDEDDFFSAFFSLPPTTASEGNTTTTGVIPVEKDTVGIRDDETNALLAGGGVFNENTGSGLPVSKSAILDSVFEVLCKHIQSVLEGVLERFLRNASSLHDGDSSSSSAAAAAGGGSGGGGGGGNSGSGSGSGNSGGGNSGISSGASGPIGLTGGITRLLSAATGRPLGLTSDNVGGVQRYQHVMNRSQQEALVVATLMSLTNGLRTAHTLLQLFTYYTYSSFTPLLGREASLTRLIADDSKLQLLRVYHMLAKQIAEHALDSVASVVSRSTVLRRLASAEAAAAAAAAAVVEDGNKKSETATSFVTEFLLEYASEEERDNDGNVINEEHLRQQQQVLSGARSSSVCSRSSSNFPNNPYHRSGLSKHQAQAADLLRTLYSMVLPTPPEVEECLRVLQSTMFEAEKHVEIMDSLRAAHLKSSPSSDSMTTNPSAYHEQFFTVLVQHVLSFPVVLARQPTISGTLDDPCKLVLQLNTMVALQETLAPHLQLLALGNAAAGHTTPLSNVVPERIHQLTKELTISLSHCAVKHYFKHKSQSGVTGSSDEMSSSVVVGSTEVEKKNSVMDINIDDDDVQFDAATITTQLSDFYGVVAATGRVYVPIIAALRSARLREEVMRGVLRALCDVYEARYKRLLQLQQQESHVEQSEGTPTSSFTVNDLDPKKLRILLDVVPASSSST